MGKQNVKSGVGTFSNINDGSAQEIRAGEGSGSWDRKRGETTSFLSVPFVELSSRASLPRPNRSRVQRDDWGRLRNAEETTSFQGLHSQKTA